MRYIPNSENNIKKKIYKFLKIKNKDELFRRIARDILLLKPEDLSSVPDKMDESSIYRYFSKINDILPNVNNFSIFAGAGIYNHFVPAAVDSILSRSEFYTPYTPYQPEASQGTLTALFEFQSMLAEILSMDAVNASMYDGAESLAEAVLMSLRIASAPLGTLLSTPKRALKVLISDGVNPAYISVMKTYLQDLGIAIETVKLDKKTGLSDLNNLSLKLDEGVFSYVVQQPNFYGIIEDLAETEKIVHKNKNKTENTAINPLFIVCSSEPFSFGTINPPGYYNADIFAGEGNSFGNYMNYGGPLLGLFAAKKEFIRQMPGRIVGKTKDAKNNDAYVFILSTREQHIRRQEATSNICTNSSLNAVRAAVYLSLCSKSGFKDISLLNLKLAHLLCGKLQETGLFKLIYTGDFYNEFAMKIKNMEAAPFLDKMADKNILGGTIVGSNEILIAVTERNSIYDIDRYVENAVSILKPFK